MRYICPEDIAKIELPEGWAVDAAAATVEVTKYANSPRAERNRVIDTYAESTWRKLKKLLGDLSGGKCWYCDCRQIRSDNTVDHFRPRGKVFDCSKHPGYWWLAFEVSNFRYSCTYCNSRRKDDTTGQAGGKHENFPLFGAFRAMTPGDDWKNEEPMLLDPTDDRDIGLLTWKIDGVPDAKFDKLQNERWWTRATISIRLYHLDHHLLNKFRKALYTAIRIEIGDGDVYFAKAMTGDQTAEIALGRVKRRIHKLTRQEAECSAAARKYLNEFDDKTRRPWLEAIV